MRRYAPTLGKVTWLLRIGPNFSAESQQACESLASVRSRSLGVLNFAHPRQGQAHAQVRTKIGKSFLAFQNRPKLFLQTCSKPASYLRASHRKLKVLRISPTLGRRKRMRRQGPKVGKVSWLVRIGPNFFCRLAANLRVICERQIANLKFPEFRHSRPQSSCLLSRD